MAGRVPQIERSHNGFNSIHLMSIRVIESQHGFY